MPELSVVMPVYDNWWLTARCLRELDRLRNGGSVSFETIVVDNASRDETPHEVRTFPWVRYLRHDVNRNFAGACNAGARLAQAPVTLLLNNDAYPLGDAFTPLVRIFDRAEVAIAGGALFFEDGLTQAAGLVLLPDAHWHYDCRNLPAQLDAVTRSRDAQAVSGAAMAVRTDWFLAAGGFDERFVNGFEDVDLCLRAREQGRTIAYVADARFIHYEAASAGRFDREAENERRFYRRWSASFSSVPRIARGDVGAIAVLTSPHESALLAAARSDLEAALRAFGHPLVHRKVAAWQRLDRRFARAGTLAWFTSDSATPGISVAPSSDSRTAIRTHGAVRLAVPWLPCAAPKRLERLLLRRSDDASCKRVGISGGDESPAEELGAELSARGYSPIRITAPMLLGDGGTDVACVVHLGLTDEAAFGNVLLAQAGLPPIVLDRAELRVLFASDVALVCERDKIIDAVAGVVAESSVACHYARLVAADSGRRFSPRRSAIRVVDLLCAARLGLERPGTARSNTPL